MTHDEMIVVITAHRDGKEIEAKFRGPQGGNNAWAPCQKIGNLFNFRDYEYRIKPEPQKPTGRLILVTGESDQEYLRCPDCKARLVYAFYPSEAHPITPSPAKPKEFWISECPHDQGTKMVFETPAIPCSNPDCKIIHVIEVLPSSGERAP